MITDMPIKQQDPRALRMLEIYAQQQFRNRRTSRRVRTLLLFWALRTRFGTFAKRVMDVAIALIALVLAAPIMLVTALLIKLDSPGPVLFRQTRVGKHGLTFACYKFRSMYIDAEERKRELAKQNEADGPVFKIRRDPRITRVGRVIRSLSIDELPQIFNVLRGEMSVVGPRPALPSEVATYTIDQALRLHAIPGITGLQQVSGRSDIDFKRWVELDVQYINEQSFWKDVEIMARTVPAVISRKGAY